MTLPDASVAQNQEHPAHNREDARTADLAGGSITCPHGRCPSESCVDCKRIGVEEYMNDHHPVALEFKEDVEGLERLTARQVRWVMAYLETNDVRKANKVAGFSGGQLLKVPAVIAIVAEERQKLLHKFEVTQERVVAELACSAFLDPGELFYDDGTVRPISDLPEHVRRAISGIDVIDGREDHTMKIRFVEKNKSVELLGKWLKMWTDKVEVEGVSALAQRLLEARKNAGISEAQV